MLGPYGLEDLFRNLFSNLVVEISPARFPETLIIKLKVEFEFFFLTSRRETKGFVEIERH